MGSDVVLSFPCFRWVVVVFPYSHILNSFSSSSSFYAICRRVVSNRWMHPSISTGNRRSRNFLLYAPSIFFILHSYRPWNRLMSAPSWRWKYKRLGADCASAGLSRNYPYKRERKSTRVFICILVILPIYKKNERARGTYTKRELRRIELVRWHLDSQYYRAFR